MDILNEAGIRMNGQIVLCKGVNDGKELEFSIQKLMEYLPNVESVSVVPVGLSKYRDGLYPLEPFNAQDAGEVIDLIEKYQKICMESMEHILSRPVMSGIFWREEKCLKRNAMMVISSWKTV